MEKLPSVRCQAVSVHGAGFQEGWLWAHAFINGLVRRRACLFILHM